MAETGSEIREGDDHAGFRGRRERGAGAAAGAAAGGPGASGDGHDHERGQLRPLLFSIAYRMLGSVSEAEDAVQETWLRYQASPTEPASAKAFLSAP